MARKAHSPVQFLSPNLAQLYMGQAQVTINTVERNLYTVNTISCPYLSKTSTHIKVQHTSISDSNLINFILWHLNCSICNQPASSFQLHSSSFEIWLGWHVAYKKQNSKNSLKGMRSCNSRIQLQCTTTAHAQKTKKNWVTVRCNISQWYSFSRIYITARDVHEKSKVRKGISFTQYSTWKEIQQTKPKIMTKGISFTHAWWLSISSSHLNTYEMSTIINSVVR
jgi:hypothetical protein